MTARRVALLILIAALTGCSGSFSPSAGGATPGASTPLTAAANGGCRLPVLVRRLDPATRAWSADATGFISYPGGTLAAVNASGVRYDARRKRWLPAGLPTPDGTAYVYGDNAGAVHRVALDSGLDQVIVAGGWVPVGYIQDRLYLAERRSLEAPLGETGYTLGRLARFNSTGDKPALLTQHEGPWWVSSLGAWTADRADGLRQAPDRVLHLDLATGAVEPWSTGVGNAMVVGFDAAGRPFIVSGADPIRVLLLTNRGTSTEVYSGPREAGWPDLPSYTEGDRVWFSGFGIKDPTFDAPPWLYQPGGSTGAELRPAVGVPGAHVSIAGPCAK